MQVIGDTRYLLLTLLRSFFDGSILRNAASEGMLGGFHEYSNFLGVAAIPAIIFGLFRLRELRSSKPFWSLLIGVLTVLTCMRTTHGGALIRMICPVFNQVTHYWRGSVVMVWVVIILMSLGYEMMFKHQKTFIGFLAVALMCINFWDIFSTYKTRMDFHPEPSLDQMFVDTDPVPVPLETTYAPCILSNIFGYGIDKPDVLSVNLKNSVYGSSDSDFFNVHDVRLLAS